MGRRRPRQKTYRFGSERLDEVAAVLEISPEASDTEICDAVNRWLERTGDDDKPLCPAHVSASAESWGFLRPQGSRSRSGYLMSKLTDWELLAG